MNTLETKLDELIAVFKQNQSTEDTKQTKNPQQQRRKKGVQLLNAISDNRTLDEIKTLIEKDGPDVLLHRTMEGSTPLLLAIRKGRPDLAEYFMSTFPRKCNLMATEDIYIRNNGARGTGNVLSYVFTYPSPRLLELALSCLHPVDVMTLFQLVKHKSFLIRGLDQPDLVKELITVFCKKTNSPCSNLFLEMVLKDALYGGYPLITEHVLNILKEKGCPGLSDSQWSGW